MPRGGGRRGPGKQLSVKQRQNYFFFHFSLFHTFSYLFSMRWVLGKFESKNRQALRTKKNERFLSKLLFIQVTAFETGTGI